MLPPAVKTNVYNTKSQSQTQRDTDRDRVRDIDRERERSTNWFNLSPVQFPPVQHDGVDGVAGPGGLHRCGEHIQEVLQRELETVLIDS